MNPTRSIRSGALVAGALVLLSGCGPARSPLHDVPTVFRHLTVIDGTGAQPRSRTTLAIEGDRITAVGPDDSVTIPRGAHVIDARGRYAIPGLWDMHVHLSKAKAEALPALVANGVTSVRDMGGDLEELHAWRGMIAASGLIGPRIKIAGPMLESPAVRERLLVSRTRENWRVTRVFVADTMSAARIVDSVSRLGVDFIKIREINAPDIYAAIARAAHHRGKMVVGHAPYALDPVQGAGLGIATFEHASYPYPLDRDPKVRRRVLDAFATNHVAIVPTLVAWQTRLMSRDSLLALAQESLGGRDSSQRLLSAFLVQEWQFDLEGQKEKSDESLREWREFFDTMASDLRAMHEAGVRIMPGSDLATAGIFPGCSLHDELQLLVRRVGLTPMEAIECATRMPAELFGESAEVGTIESGRRADVVLLEADPLEDIANVRRIVGVVVGGRYLDERRVRELLGGLGPVAQPLGRSRHRTAPTGEHN